MNSKWLPSCESKIISVAFQYRPRGLVVDCNCGDKVVHGSKTIKGYRHVGFVTHKITYDSLT